MVLKELSYYGFTIIYWTENNDLKAVLLKLHLRTHTFPDILKTFMTNLKLKEQIRLYTVDTKRVIVYIDTIAEILRNICLVMELKEK